MKKVIIFLIFSIGILLFTNCDRNEKFEFEVEYTYLIDYVKGFYVGGATGSADCLPDPRYRVEIIEKDSITAIVIAKHIDSIEAKLEMRNPTTIYGVGDSLSFSYNTEGGGSLYLTKVHGGFFDIIFESQF